MAERRLKAILSAEIAGYVRAMAEAAASTRKTKTAAEDLGKAAQESGQKSTQASKQQEDAAKQTAAAAEKQAQAQTEIGTTAAVMGTATLAAVGGVVKSYADFDKQMSSVRASTHETAGNMDLLRDAAVKAGADTAFSATEAAQGIDELAKAGVSTKDILGGGLTGALDLAAAGELAVGEAAEIAATAMTQFKLSGDQLPHVADLLAAGAGKAQGSVQDMGMALNQAGLVASATGLSIEETTGSLAAFASAGLVGSDAGTSFKSMLQRLQNPSKEAAEVMGQLGINMYDANGEFVGMSDLAGQLQTSMAGLTQAERDKAMATIFGSDAVRASNVLYQEGAAGIKEWESAVNDAGFAAETAALKQDNLAGDLDKLGGSLDSVFLQSGSGVNDVLRGLVQGLESLVDMVGQVPGPVLGTVTVIAGLVGVAGLLGGGLITVLPKIAATREAIDTLAPAGSRAARGLGRVTSAAKGGTIALAAIGAAATLAAPMLDKINGPTDSAAHAIKKFSGEAAQGAISADTLAGSFADLGGKGTAQAEVFGKALNGVFDPKWGANAENLIAGALGFLSLGMIDVTTHTEEARSRFAAMGEELSSLDAEKAAASFQSMASQTDGSQESLGRLLELMPAYRESLESQAEAAGLATDDQTLLKIAMGEITPVVEGAAESFGSYTDATGQAVPITEDMAEQLEEVGITAEGAIVALDKYTEALFAAGLSQMSAREATAAHQEALDANVGAIAAATDALAKQYEMEGMSAESAKALATEQVNLGGALNGTKDDFDLTNAAGRALNDQFSAVASTGMAEIEAKAKAGVGQPELQANLRSTYDSLITTLAGFGITGDGADTLARRVMGVPKEANVDSWMSDAAKQMAEQTTGAINAIPKRVEVNYVNTTTNIVRSINDESHIAEGPGGRGGMTRAHGGRIPRHAIGGKLPSTGPGTERTDGILGISSKTGQAVSWLDGGEWIVNAKSSDKHHNLIAAVNRDDPRLASLPMFAGGGRASSREYSAAAAYGFTAGAAQQVHTHHHTHVSADPGLGYEYASSIAIIAEQRSRDREAAYGNRRR